MRGDRRAQGPGDGGGPDARLRAGQAGHPGLQVRGVLRGAVPSPRSRLVVAKKRSGFLMLGLPACASERPVIWFTIALGRAAATTSPTDTASSPSIAAPSAPTVAASPAWPRSSSSPSPGGHGPPAAGPAAARTACHEHPHNHHLPDFQELTLSPKTRQLRPSVTWGPVGR
jgi:hypothetical protein